jgi:hypothetical protein
MQNELIASVLCACLLSACSASGPKYSDDQGAQPTAPADEARIVVFRRGETEGSARSVALHIDGTFLGKCDYKGYNVFEVSPGQHVLTVGLWDAPGSCKLPVTVEAGTSYYYRLKPRDASLIAGMVGGVIGMAIESAGKQCGGAFSIEPVEQDSWDVHQLGALRRTQ